LMQVIVMVIVLCLAVSADEDEENNNTKDSFDAVFMAQPVYLMNEKMWQAAAGLHRVIIHL